MSLAGSVHTTQTRLVSIPALSQRSLSVYQSQALAVPRSQAAAFDLQDRGAVSAGSGHSNTSLEWCAHLAAFFALLPRMGPNKSPPMSATGPWALSSKATERQGAWRTSAAAAALPRARSAHRRQRCALLHLARRLPHIRRAAHRHHAHVRPCRHHRTSTSSHEHGGPHDPQDKTRGHGMGTRSARQRK